MTKDIIYFTKEDGKNKLLSIAHSNCLESVDDITNNLMNLYIKRLGHKPTNIYALIDGTEFKLLI